MLNAEANVELDITAAEALDALRTSSRRRHRVRAGAGQAGPARGAGRAGLVDVIGEERIYMTLPTAVAAYREWVAAES